MAGRKRVRYRYLSPVDRRWVEGRLRAGVRPRLIALDLGCHVATVRRVRADMWLRRRQVDSGFRLSFEEREEIAVRVARGESNAQIARVLGRHRSTVGREIARCRGRGQYRAVSAQRKADRLARRPKASRLAGNPRLLAAVEAGLRECWSPEQISAKLRLEYRGDRSMQISHETIYQSLYVQSRGELRRELTAQLRTRRTARKPQGQKQHRGRIKDMVNIAERPPEVDDRRVPGHWEGDLLGSVR